MSRRFARCVGLALLLAAVVGLLAANSRGDDHTSPRWYKGNIHAHSFWSDGDEFPEMVTDWFKSHGYDFLALSDHDQRPHQGQWREIAKLTPTVLATYLARFGEPWVQTRSQNGKLQVKLRALDEYRNKFEEPGKFLLIANEEITSHCRECNVHLNAINLSDAIRPKVGDTVLETVRLNVAAVEEQAARTGRTILVQLNHPNWSNYDVAPEDVAQVVDLKFFEVGNCCPGTRFAGDANHPGTERFWDIVNTIRIARLKAAPVYGTATDDSHHYHVFGPNQLNPGRGWLMVRAKQLTTEALVDAMARGDFYASTGVTLRDVCYDAKAGTYTVEVDPKPGVRYTIEFVGTLAGTDSNGQLVTLGNSDTHTDTVQKYSPEIGKILATMPGPKATYHRTGKELYIRAVVRSDQRMANPPAGDLQEQRAWCQPVGWETPATAK